ncbi:MAG TPA: S8 family serine peptidase, partial [Actinomycetota bacterium]
MRKQPATLLAVAVLAVGLSGPAGAQTVPDPRLDRDDAVVVAVIDGSFNPYHWNFVGAKMPQHLDEDPNNDLPLDQAPHTWLPGFPDPSAFTSYSELKPTLDTTNPNRSVSSLRGADNAKWNGVQTSTAAASHYYWLSGTKVIGAVDFAGNNITPSASNTFHGNGTSSVAVGNIHGTCPECLVVFITYGGADREAALNWAMSQPWIDAVTNSYGFSLVERDRIYDGGNAAQQRTASERGQTILFSSGNGISNTFSIPNSTLRSSQEGPDWTVTVGAVHPANGTSYSGSGKPADIASLGGGYPSGYGGSTVTGTGNFSGTSNSTPVIAGIYGNALLQARRALPGPSRAQDQGVVAVQQPDPERGESPFACGSTRPDCELGDGVLTARELRLRLFHGAVHTPAGMNVAGSGEAPPIGEDEFINEGHGTYFGRLNGTEAWQAEQARISGPMQGTAAALQRPAGEADWMMVDSLCRQGLWLPWRDGYYTDGMTLPADNPLFPIRTALRHTCERALFDQLPNLVPWKPYDISVGSTDDNTGPALRFTVSTANRGRFALDLTAVPNAGFPNTSQAFQCVLWATDRACVERREVGSFTFHQTHLHYHFEDYADYELRTLDAYGQPDMSPGGLAAPGVKASFCLIDYDPENPQGPLYQQPHPLYLTCTGSFGVGVQGISPGWRDTYESGLDGQQIPIT